MLESRLYRFSNKFLEAGWIVRWDLKQSEDLFKPDSDNYEELGYQHCLASCLARKLKGDSRKEAEKIAKDILKTKVPLADYFERIEPLYTELILKKSGLV